MRPLISSVLLILLLGARAQASPPPPTQTTAQTVRILFIGNSLTYTNDLPAQLAAMAKRARVKVVTESLTLPNYSLGDHLQEGKVLGLIRNGSWDFVVMQQGPSGLDSSRVDLLRDARILGGAAVEVRARPVLYMVWPSRSRERDFERVAESYRLAAEAARGIVAPVADVWRAAWKRDFTIALYGPDGLHPSAAGTYLAALTLYRTLIGPIPPMLATVPVARDIAGPSFEADPRQLGIMVAVAEESVKK